MIELFYENLSEENIEYDFEPDKLASVVINETLSYFRYDEFVDVSLYLVTEDYIREINNETRGIDKVTDVLSFPNIDFITPGDFGIIDKDESFYEYFDPDTKHLILGDIVICKKRMEEQAKEYGHGIKREFAFLVTHSILHLLGFDHIEENDRILMEEKQRIILDKLNITR